MDDYDDSLKANGPLSNAKLTNNLSDVRKTIVFFFIGKHFQNIYDNRTFPSEFLFDR